MPCRQTIYAHDTKAALIEKRGGKCELCGSTKDLQFDHTHGRDYEPSKLSFSSRMARYKREEAAGLIRLLCETCNLAARKTNDNGQFVPTASTPVKTDEIPF